MPTIQANRLLQSLIVTSLHSKSCAAASVISISLHFNHTDPWKIIYDSTHAILFSELSQLAVPLSNVVDSLVNEADARM